MLQTCQGLERHMFARPSTISCESRNRQWNTSRTHTDGTDQDHDVGSNTQHINQHESRHRVTGTGFSTVVHAVQTRKRIIQLKQFGTKSLCAIALQCYWDTRSFVSGSDQAAQLMSGATVPHSMHGARAFSAEHCCCQKQYWLLAGLLQSRLEGH